MCTEVKHAGVGRARQRCGGTSTDSRSSGMAVRRGSKPGQGILSPGDGPVLGLGSRPRERLGQGPSWADNRVLAQNGFGIKKLSFNFQRFY
jgi:hypothetical protein